jgi:hypothetical protein
MKTTQLELDRAEYSTIRASCARHSARRFNEIAASIAHELADGEDIAPSLYLRAARMICAGSDCA